MNYSQGPRTLSQVYTEHSLMCSGERIEFDSMSASYISNGKDVQRILLDYPPSFSYQRRVGEHIHSISDLIPVEVETKEVPEKWLHS